MMIKNHGLKSGRDFSSSSDALFPRAFIQQAGLRPFIVRRGLPVTHTHLTLGTVA